MNAVERRIADFIETKLSRDAGPPIAADTALVNGGLELDSVDLLELILTIEEEFGLVVEDTDLSIELLRDVRSLGAFVEAKLAGAGRGPPG